MTEITIISSPIPLAAVGRTAKVWYGDMTKAVVDLKQHLMALGGKMHADAEAVLLEQGSSQEDLWGINLYPDRYPTDWIEYHSLINIRPKQNNRSMEIENPQLRDQIRSLVEQLIQQP